MTETTEDADALLADPLTVGQVADLFGVTRRTLHHYDEIGLVVPGERSHAGYRLYTRADLTRLHHVVVYRRLGFPLEEIALLLAEPEHAADHLRRQRAAVLTRLYELHQLVEAIDTALEKTMNEQPLTAAEMKDLFGEDYREEWATEAEQRWGDTDAWRQSQSRTKSFTKDDWARIKADNDTLLRDFAAAMTAGEPADGPVGAALAERHRASIEVYYDCPHQMQVGLAQMYLADPRFTAYYEKAGEGLAQYVHDAIVANAAAQA